MTAGLYGRLFLGYEDGISDTTTPPPSRQSHRTRRTENKGRYPVPSRDSQVRRVVVVTLRARSMLHEHRRTRKSVSNQSSTCSLHAGMIIGLRDVGMCYGV